MTAQFDVFKNTNRSTKALYPFLVDIQSNLLSELHTTVPLCQDSCPPGSMANSYTGNQISNLHPIFKIEGRRYLSMTTLIAGIDRSSLGEKVSSLVESRDEIISSLDFMITGI